MCIRDRCKWAFLNKIQFSTSSLVWIGVHRANCLQQGRWSLMGAETSVNTNDRPRHNKPVNDVFDISYVFFEVSSLYVHALFQSTCPLSSSPFNLYIYGFVHNCEINIRTSNKICLTIVCSRYIVIWKGRKMCIRDRNYKAIGRRDVGRLRIRWVPEQVYIT